MRLFRYLLSLRGLLIAAVVAAACFLSNRYSQHHSGDNVFTTLYMHLVPSVLVEPAHGEAGAEHDAHALLEVTLPKL